MFDFIHSYLLENNFQINEERAATVYYKHIPDVVNDSKKRFRFEVLIQNNNLITISETLENHKDNSESQFLICRSFYVNNLEELKYLFSNNLSSEYLLF